MNLVWSAILLILSIGLLFAFIRLVIGPRLPDRVIALDLITVLALGFIVVYAVRFNQPNFLDVAIILALITFLGTIAFAFYIERRM